MWEERVRDFVGGEENMVGLQEGCSKQISKGVVFAGKVEDGCVGDA